MKLHQTLAELAQDHGHALFRDATAFRGSLDDYLDEGQASNGTINLLTDAVRLGALDGMLTMLDSGASSADAVDSAGQRLARDRGSADVRGCQWAVSVLGFALGKVPEDLVEGLDPEAQTTAPPAHGPGGTAPAGPQVVSPVAPAQQPIYSPPHQPAVSPPHQPVVSPAHQSVGGGYGTGAPSYAGAGWSQPAPRKKSNTGFIVGAVVVALIVMVGGIFGIIALAGDDGGGGGGGGGKADDKLSEEVDLGGPTVEDDDYDVQLAKGWQDGTERFLAENPDGGGGTFERVFIWGETIATGRGNIIVESQSAFGSTDPEDLKANWKNALTSSTPDATIDEVDDIEIDGQKALTVDIQRTNDSGVELTQRSHLVVNGEKAWSLTVTLKRGDDDVLEKFEEILSTWKWAEQAEDDES